MSESPGYYIYEKPSAMTNIRGVTYLALAGDTHAEQGRISLHIDPDKPSVVQLEKITTYYLRSDSLDDFGGQGRGTGLLLQGVLWAIQNGATELSGMYAPDTDFYATVAWYSKRQVFVTDDLNYVYGDTIKIAAACIQIIGSHRVQS